MSLRLRLIGQMEAWTLNSDSVLPVGRKTRSLLAVVALASPRPVLRSRLAELLWSRRPEEQARASLRQELHRLLETLGPVGAEVLVVTRDHVSLRPGTVWVDVERVQRASVANPAGLALLDGEMLEGLDGVDPAFDAWLHGERERLRDRARGVAEALLREQTTPESVIAVANQLLTIDRAHEGAWRALMRAHAERGERGMAIQCYERCRAVLTDLLDATPSPETQRLAAEIRSGRVQTPAAAPLVADPVAPPAEPLPSVPLLASRGAPRGGARVGVLPLQLIGTDDQQAHLAHGLAEEITSALARFRWMFLVASSSLAQFAAQSRDETEIRQMFGLDFLLDGTVQRAGKRLRITLRLQDLREGNQVVWARRFDRESDDLLTLQDEIAAEVVAQIDPEILMIESRRASHRPPHDASAYHLMLRAIPLMNRMDPVVFAQAGDLLRRAIALEPDYAAAHAWLAQWHIFLLGQGWAEDAPEQMAEARRLAERAISLDPQDALGLTIAGHVRAFLNHRLREAIALHDRALTHNPNLSMAWALSAASSLYLGHLDDAERKLRRYKQLSPMDPHAFFYDTAFVMLALLRRDYETAAECGRAVSELNPAFSAVCKPYLAALGYLGLTPEAEAVKRRLLGIEPGFTVSGYIQGSAFMRTEDCCHVAEGLRLAGISEGAPVSVAGCV